MKIPQFDLGDLVDVAIAGFFITFFVCASVGMLALAWYIIRAVI